MRSSDYIATFISRRSAVIGAFRSSIVPASSCYLSGPLFYRSPFSSSSTFKHFNSVIPVNVIRMKSYVDCFLDPTCVPVRVSINKLHLVQNWMVADLLGVFRNSGGLGTGESYMTRRVKEAIHIRLHPNNINIYYY